MSQRVWLYISTIAVGLWISATGAGNLLSDGAAGRQRLVLGCFHCHLCPSGPKRHRDDAVVALATPMELFFSEVWHIYEYQRGLMPLFVPAGHYFLFDLGREAS